MSGRRVPSASQPGSLTWTRPCARSGARRNATANGGQGKKELLALAYGALPRVGYGHAMQVDWDILIADAAEGRIDRTDWRILDAIFNWRITGGRAIAEHVGIPPRTANYRMRRLCRRMRLPDNGLQA